MVVNFEELIDTAVSLWVQHTFGETGENELPGPSKAYGRDCAECEDCEGVGYKDIEIYTT